MPLRYSPLGKPFSRDSRRRIEERHGRRTAQSGTGPADPVSGNGGQRRGNGRQHRTAGRGGGNPSGVPGGGGGKLDRDVDVQSRRGGCRTLRPGAASCPAHGASSRQDGAQGREGHPASRGPGNVPPAPRKGPQGRREAPRPQGPRAEGRRPKTALRKAKEGNGKRKTYFPPSVFLLPSSPRPARYSALNRNLNVPCGCARKVISGA